MVPNLLLSNKHLNNDLRDMVSLLGCSVWSQELYSMILMGPLQLRIFYDSKY